MAVTNNSASAATWRLATTVPRRHLAPAAAARILAPDGRTLATVAGTGTLRLTAHVGAGRHILAVDPTVSDGTATVAATAPDRPLRLAVSYDAHDHATRIDDGDAVTVEDLSPSGRVLRRRVTDALTGELREDVVVGYAGDGDGPRPAAGGQVTTWVAGPEGLLAVTTAAGAAWPLANTRGTQTAGRIPEKGSIGA